MLPTLPPDDFIKYTSELTVKCDGGDTQTGHPAVYLSLEKLLHVECPYCGQRFVKQP